MAAKLGRPTENPKITQFRVRLTSDESKMLSDCAKALNLTKTSVLLNGLKLVYNKIKK